MGETAHRAEPPVAGPASWTASLAGKGPALAGFAVPFILVLYLALRGGGYDAVVRGEVGIVLWWVVLLGAILGLLPSVAIPRVGWLALAVFVAFAAWTGIGVVWSESAERAVAELGRVGAYLAVFAFTLCVQGRDAIRRTVGAIAAALAVVAVLALLSRLHPSWFPENSAGIAIDAARARLNYPVDYWNGLAALMAIATPLLLTIALESRRIAVRAVITAVLPIIALVTFMTLSRGGAVELAFGLVAFIALFPRRLQALPTIALGAVGSTALIVAAESRDAFIDNRAGAEALEQADEVAVLVVVVCAVVGLLAAGLALATGRWTFAAPRIGGRPLIGALAAAALVAVAIAVVADAPSELSERWEAFKDPASPTGDVSRFDSSSGSGRYQYWSAAVDAGAEEPLTGIGPGSYEFYWAQAGDIPGFVRDAHSLYLESFGELGLIGWILICAFVLGVTGLAVWRALHAELVDRPWLAGVAAACVAFAVAAAIDWVWEIAVIPVVFLLLAAAVVGRAPETVEPPAGVGARSRLALAVLALLGLVAIAIPLAATDALRASQGAVRAGRLDLALERAEDAEGIQPYAASPRLQVALVHELAGDLDPAAAAAREATERESTNWRTWLVLSRVEAYRGNAAASVDAYERARSLNPRSQLFDQGK